MVESVEVLVFDSRYFDKLHAFIKGVVVLDHMRPAVNDDLMSTLDQPGAQFFYCGFKAAISARNAPRTQHCDFHLDSLMPK